MSGIGISPCPPFNKIPAIPGILYDGNTVAWYKYTDPRTVIYDGANRVSFWLDSLHYAIGANMMPNPLNFMNVNWTILGGGVKINDHSFSTVLAGGLRNLNYTWILGSTYHLRFQVTLTAGSFFRIYERAGVNLYYTSPAGTGALQTIDTYIYINAITVNGIYINLDAGSVIDFNYLIIEITNGNHLMQQTAANMPVFSNINGLLFDGIDDYLRSAFVYVQPEFIYFVGRQLTWTINDRFFDGINDSSGIIVQAAVSPELTAFAGIVSPADNHLPLNTFGIIRVLFNGANSIFQINLNAAFNGNLGALNMGGFVLGTRGSLANFFGNIQVKEIILRNIADNITSQTSIYNYLKKINSLP